MRNPPLRIAVVALNESRLTAITLDGLENVGATCLRSFEQEARSRRAAPANQCALLYVANDRHSAWAKHCLSQATRTVFITDANAYAEGQVATALGSSLPGNTSLLLVRDGNAPVLTVAPRGWPLGSEARQILHVRAGSRIDLEGAVRLVSDEALCLVLSGGGARALAHVGALLAFEEKDIKIDAVGGASMGALIAALVAQGREAQEILDGMRSHVAASNPICDYNFPFVSLVRGRKMGRLFGEIFGDATIESLRKPFFCVSTDLTSRSMVVHRSGTLSHALRASTAIPGILPPVTDDGRVLVDGCVMDSLPTTVMRSLQRGLVVGVDVSSTFSLTAADVSIKPRSWLGALRQGRGVPPLARILMSAAVVGGSAHLSASRAAADVLIEPKLSGIGLLSFKAFDQAVEAGYRAAMDAIQHLTAPRVADKPLLRMAA